MIKSKNYLREYLLEIFERECKKHKKDILNSINSYNMYLTIIPIDTSSRETSKTLFFILTAKDNKYLLRQNIHKEILNY